MIYHYTDLNAVKSIIENSKLWLTDYKFLNDKEELRAGYRILVEALNDFDDYPEECSQEFIERMQVAISYITTQDLFSPNENKIFVSSFSLASDSLSQWRSYGMFSVEFDESDFAELQAKKEIYFLDCKYILDSGDALDDANDIIKDSLIPHMLKVYNSEPHWLEVELSYMVDIYALTFKHAAFYEEQEKRLVISCGPDDDDIKFRAKGNILIPYLEFEFPHSSIQSVMIGPIDNQDLSEDSLVLFTSLISRRIAKKENKPEFHINIESSALPYRNL
ncbi:hypothetical protein A3464_15275 [Enterobacter genomosp. O]|uniref:hypothetical protein n=1 Tax=Enterobacter genomosp. O TaxID=2364150 RepID=UPI0007B36B2C|nr:hypothetical protein [Enterobacter genomosp. O]KZQ37513.1 hypothetical protein A3464_15275 [Enterobacter genomosp. O]